MPERSGIDRLPEDIRNELNRRLIENRFSGYQDLSDWLKEEGFEISRSSVGRYGKNLRERMEAIAALAEQAKSLSETHGDKSADLAQLATNLGLSAVVNALLEGDFGEEQNLPKLISALGQLNKTVVPLDKYRQELKAKAEQASQEIAQDLKQAGMSDDMADSIREKLLGIVTG